MTTNSAQYLSSLHKEMDARFSLGELHTLCFNLGIDYENVPGDTKSVQIRNLLTSLARQGNLQSLVDMVRMERPRVPWQDVPADFELPPSIAHEDIRQVVHYTIYGDYVGGDKIGGDKISVGNITGSTGLAIGRDANATVTTTTHDRSAGEANLGLLFVPLQILVLQNAPTLFTKVSTLMVQVELGSSANDEQVAGLIQDIADGVPAARPTLLELFADPQAAPAAAGGATRFVLSRLK
jgi:hypothetical protein